MADNKKTITEEMHLEKEWFEQASCMKEEDLPDFFKKMVHEYDHDYGTACHAVAACALAAAWAACGNENVGLSNFQAGFVMWDFIMNWTLVGNKCGAKLIDYDDFLYPQYEEKFSKTIKRSIWEKIQKEAKEKLNACDEWVSLSVKQHWENIVNGAVPFGYTIVED